MRRNYIHVLLVEYVVIILTSLGIVSRTMDDCFGLIAVFSLAYLRHVGPTSLHAVQSFFDVGIGIIYVL